MDGGSATFHRFSVGAGDEVDYSSKKVTAATAEARFGVSATGCETVLFYAATACTGANGASCGFADRSLVDAGARCDLAGMTAVVYLGSCE